MISLRPRHLARPLGIATLVVGAISAGACDDTVAPTMPSGPPGEVVRSSRPRLTAAAPAEDTRQLTADNVAFGVDVVERLPSRENAFLSPHSISVALAMTYAGARGETATQMASALRFTLPEGRLHAAFGALDLTLSRRGETPPQSGEAFRLKIVNAIWGQRGYAFRTEYLDLLAEHYGAGLSLLDFASNPEGSRVAINTWVSDETRGLIPELLPLGIVRSSTVLVLTNAISFKASWEMPFDVAKTAPGPFVGIDGSARSTPLMHQQKSLRYADGDGWQALELPYVGGEVSMIVLLPASGTFDAWRSALDGGRIESILSLLSTRAVDVALPRFSFRTELPLKTTLQALGITDAFEGGKADLSGMDGSRSLFVQDVIHEAFVSVDERGTEAAAATAVVVGKTSAPEPATFIADRPFLFLIRDNPTGAVLFLGQLTRP